MRLPSTPVLALPTVLVGVAIGIAVSGAPGDAGLLVPVVAVAAVAAASAGVAVTGRLAPAGLVAAWALAVLLGAWRGAASELPTGPGTVVGAIGSGEEVVVGTLVDEPRPREDRFQLTLDEVSAAGQGLRGRLLAWVPRTLDLVPGDRIRLSRRARGAADDRGLRLWRLPGAPGHRCRRALVRRGADRPSVRWDH